MSLLGPVGAWRQGTHGAGSGQRSCASCHGGGQHGVRAETAQVQYNENSQSLNASRM